MDDDDDTAGNDFAAVGANQVGTILSRDDFAWLDKRLRQILEAEPSGDVGEVGTGASTATEETMAA